MNANSKIDAKTVVLNPTYGKNTVLEEKFSNIGLNRETVKKVMTILEEYPITHEQCMALQALQMDITNSPLPNKQPYKGFEEDGAASEYLKKHYAYEIDNEILNVSILRATDTKLYNAFHNEINNYNKSNPNSLRSVSELVIPKEEALKHRAKNLQTLFNVRPNEILRFMGRVSRYKPENLNSMTQDMSI